MSILIKTAYDKTCKTCQNFHRDKTTKAGGWCPVKKTRGITPFDTPLKYVRQSRLACKHYTEAESRE